MINFKLKIDTFGNFDQDFRFLERFQDNIFALFSRKNIYMLKVSHSKKKSETGKNIEY